MQPCALTHRVKTTLRAAFFLYEISRMPDARQVEEWYSKYCDEYDAVKPTRGMCKKRWSKGIIFGLWNAP
jgi:hypothetical protein